MSWRAALDLEWNADHNYIAILANWEDVQVVWINHVIRSYRH